MKRILCCLALSALSALSETWDGSGAPLRIYTDFQTNPSGMVEGSIERNLEALVAPTVLKLDWKSLAEPRNGEPSQALVVVTFQGRCNVSGLQRWRILPGPLAWTHISNGVILPLIDVDCDRLRDFLQARLVQTDGRLREQLFGRAISRLIGHEIYHVFADTRHHEKEGLTQPGFTAGELLSDGFEFAEKEFRTLRSSLLAPLLGLRKTIGKPLPALSGRSDYAIEGCAECHGAAGEGTRGAPALRGAKKTLNPNVLIAHFEKKREDMYRRARNLNLEWQFPNDEQIHGIAVALGAGLD